MSKTSIVYTTVAALDQAGKLEEEAVTSDTFLEYVETQTADKCGSERWHGRSSRLPKFFAC